MASRDPFLVPRGWRSRREAGAVVATAPGATLAGPRLVWRRVGPDPASEQVDVEDEDSYDLAGHPVDYRRLGGHEGEVAVVHEEWTWQLGEQRWSLRGTVDRRDYLAVCELFEDVAATVEPDRWAS